MSDQFSVALEPGAIKHATYCTSDTKHSAYARDIPQLTWPGLLGLKTHTSKQEATRKGQRDKEAAPRS